MAFFRLMTNRTALTQIFKITTQPHWTPVCVRHFASKTPNPEDNSPVKFSTSEAAVSERLKVKMKSNAPWFERYVIMASLSAFMIYFCILREENDLDQELKVSLYDRLPGLEKIQIETSIEFNRQHGKDITDLQKRLDEITNEEATSNE